MPSRSTLVSEIQQLLTGEHADPRAAQAVFLIPVVVELVLRVLAPGGPDSYFFWGCGIAALPTLGSVVIGRGLVSARWTLMLPVLDILALGVFRLSDSTAIGIAVAFPAIWLGLQFGRKGVSVTIGTVVVAFVLPTIVVSGFNLEGLSRITQLPLMSVICPMSLRVDIIAD